MNNNNHLTHRQRIEGGLIGLLVGDALGVPYEFNHPNDLPPLDHLEMTPPSGFIRSHVQTPPGTWSDDGAQALALLASLLDCNELNLDDFGRRLVAWYDYGYMAVDNRVFDVGIQTADAIRRMMHGTAADVAGSTNERANGNGSLMRVLPLALWHTGSDAELVDDAHRQSIVTHGHIRSQVCCALYCLWARRIMQDADEPWEDAVRTLRSIYRDASPYFAELEETIRPDDDIEGHGRGYVVDCLRSARRAVQAGDYRQVIIAAISLGDDTDTTACVAGGIAGVRDGADAIPQSWRDQLRGKDLYEPLLEQLLQRHEQL